MHGPSCRRGILRRAPYPEWRNMARRATTGRAQKSAPSATTRRHSNGAPAFRCFVACLPNARKGHPPAAARLGHGDWRQLDPRRPPCLDGAADAVEALRQQRREAQVALGAHRRVDARRQRERRRRRQVEAQRHIQVGHVRRRGVDGRHGSLGHARRAVARGEGKPRERRGAQPRRAAARRASWAHARLGRHRLPHNAHCRDRFRARRRQPRCKRGPRKGAEARARARARAQRSAPPRHRTPPPPRPPPRGAHAWGRRDRRASASDALRARPRPAGCWGRASTVCTSKYIR